MTNFKEKAFLILITLHTFLSLSFQTEGKIFLDKSKEKTNPKSTVNVYLIELIGNEKSYIECQLIIIINDILHL